MTSLRIDLAVIFAKRDEYSVVRAATRVAGMQLISAALAAEDGVLSSLYSSKLEGIALDRPMSENDVSNYFKGVLETDSATEVQEFSLADRCNCVRFD